MTANSKWKCAWLILVIDQSRLLKLTENKCYSNLQSLISLIILHNKILPPDHTTYVVRGLVATLGCLYILEFQTVIQKNPKVNNN